MDLGDIQICFRCTSYMLCSTRQHCFRCTSYHSWLYCSGSGALAIFVPLDMLARQRVPPMVYCRRLHPGAAAIFTIFYLHKPFYLNCSGMPCDTVLLFFIAMLYLLTSIVASLYCLLQPSASCTWSQSFRTLHLFQGTKGCRIGKTTAAALAISLMVASKL